MVEDAAIVAMDLVHVLRDEGCTVVGPVGTVRDALAHVERTPIDAAVVDLNLRGEPAFPLMDALAKAEIPFIILTGYTREKIPARFRHCAYVAKPYLDTEIVEQLALMLSSKSGSN